MANTITVMTSPHLDTPEVVDQIELPDTLAGLVETAIADALSLDPETYHPKSQQWHNPNTEGCVICLAGCIIARTLQRPREPDSLSLLLLSANREQARCPRRDALRSLEPRLLHPLRT